MATKSPYIKVLEIFMDQNGGNFRRAFAEIQRQQVTPEKAETAAKNLLSNTMQSLAETLNKSRYTAYPLPKELPETGWVLGFSDLRNLAHGRSSGAYVLLQENGKTLFGAFLDFLTPQLIWAMPGEGTFADRKYRVAAREQLAHGLLALPWRTADTRKLNLLETANAVDLHTRKTSQPVQDALALAAGEVDVLVQASLSPAEALLSTLFIREAGGYVTDLKGNPVEEGDTEILAANPKLHSLYLKHAN